MTNTKIHIIPALKENYTFLIECLTSNIIACIDPTTFQDVDNYLISNNLKLDYILNTHHHWDHVGGNLELKEKYNCKIYANKKDAKRIPGADILISPEDKIKIGNIEFEIIDLPGHTIGIIGFHSQKENLLFTGDVIFSSGCGYLFEGTYEQAYNSLKKIKQLPAQTKIYCAHEYTLANIEFALTIDPNNQDLLEKQKTSKTLRSKNLPTIPTTVENELKTNPFLRTLNPEIRKNINKTTDSYNVEVFEKLRKLKNSF